jgi:hypothetical protein
VDQRREIRSYGVVFSLERRLHRIDRFRIPLPYGLPLRSVGYAAVLLTLVLAVDRVPGVGGLLGALPTPFRIAVVPGVGSYLLTRVRIDGRPAGAAAAGALVYLVQPRRLGAWQPRQWDRVVRVADLTLAPSGDGPALRRGTVRGPCDVALQCPVATRARRHSTIITCAREGRGARRGSIVLRAGERLVVR